MARRRRQPLHPQIQAREEGAGVARRRSPRLHPQIEATEAGAGMVRRRSPRLHPQIGAGEDGAGMVRCIRRRRGKSPAEPASLPDSDDILREILVRLSPQPSSLPRASAVCKRWRGIVTDPKFHRQFRSHHQKPPLLGFFDNMSIVFISIMDPPDRIPPERFDLGRNSRNLNYYLLDSRHGLVLLRGYEPNEVVVCDPITGHQRCLAIPSELRMGYLLGAVLCAAGDHDHVHGGCHSGPFKVVLVSLGKMANQTLALVCVYSSETGVWSDLISSAAPCEFWYDGDPATMVGNALYWLPMPDRILEFDLDGQSIAAIEGPTVTNDLLHDDDDSRRIIKGGDGVVGFAILSLLMFQTWQRKVNGHGIATWVPWKTIEMHTILGHPPLTGSFTRLLGYDEDNGVMLLYVNGSVYTVLLMSMQSRKLHETHGARACYPFSSFYTPAIREGDDADMLHYP